MVRSAAVCLPHAAVGATSLRTPAFCTCSDPVRILASGLRTSPITLPSLHAAGRLCQRVELPGNGPRLLVSQQVCCSPFYCDADLHQSAAALSMPGCRASPSRQCLTPVNKQMQQPQMQGPCIWGPGPLKG